MPSDPDNAHHDDNPSDPDRLRAADVDREFVAERLRTALNEGRITLSEYDDRVQETYAARTYGDLKALLTDLPDATPPGRSHMVPVHTSVPSPPVARPSTAGQRRHWLAGMWSSWITVACILVVIWALSGADSFWPAWPLGVWGAVLLASTIRGLAAGGPQAEARRRVERQAYRDAHRRHRDDFGMGRHDGTGSA